MSDLIQIMGDNLMTYIFGNYLIAGLFVLALFGYMMIRLHFSLDGLIVVGVPLVALMSASWLGLLSGPLAWIMILVALAVGVLVGLAILGMFKR